MNKLQKYLTDENKPYAPHNTKYTTTNATAPMCTSIKLFIDKTSEPPRLHVQHSHYTTNILYNQNMETACKTNKTTGRLQMKQAEMKKYIHVGFIN
jgi:hypothetical protein